MDRYKRIEDLLTTGETKVVVHFKNKKGDIRVMTVAPQEIKNHVLGAAAPAGKQHGNMLRHLLHPHLLNVWDEESQAIKSVNMDTTFLIEKDGIEYTVFE
jgi:Holliday junction resolvasome RuvABC endonuclease subunit